jgi:hypothetical protein
MAAALGAWEAGCRKILLAERTEQLGGILLQCLHSGFGLIYFGETLTGPEYAHRYLQKLHKLRIDALTGSSIIALRPDGTALLSGPTCGLINIKAGAVILASGCRERPIGALPVTGTRPSGIFTAGSAQKMVNLGGYAWARFIILGSGDVGMIMARPLTLLGRPHCRPRKEARCGGLERNQSIVSNISTTPSGLLYRDGSPRHCPDEGVTARDLSMGTRSISHAIHLLLLSAHPERELS